MEETKACVFVVEVALEHGFRSIVAESDYIDIISSMKK